MSVVGGVDVCVGVDVGVSVGGCKVAVGVCVAVRVGVLVGGSGVFVWVGGWVVFVWVGVVVKIVGVLVEVGVSVGVGGKITGGLMIARPINAIITIKPTVTPPILSMAAMHPRPVPFAGESSRVTFTSSMIS